METIKNTLETEAIFSDDQQHRYLLKKTWDSEKKNDHNHHNVSKLYGASSYRFNYPIDYEQNFRNGSIWFHQFCESIL